MFTFKRYFIRLLTEFPQPVNFVNLGTAERYEMGKFYKYIAIFWKENESNSQGTVSAYRMFWKVIIQLINILVFIFITLQEVVYFNTGKKKRNMVIRFI